MQWKVSQGVCREWCLFSTICQEKAQNCRIQRRLGGLVRAAALPLLHRVEAASGLVCISGLSAQTLVFKMVPLTFEVCRTLDESLETK